MRPIEEKTAPIARGGILYDASRVRNPADALFDRAHWASQGALEEVGGGRGTIAVLRAGEERWVLRRYRRGGWAARVTDDRYLWMGEARTRSFAEWRLLAHLRARNLPAPAPIAARYVREGCTYRADLITEQVPRARTLAEAISCSPSLEQGDWRQVGLTVAAFHREGAYHADLNANNILLTADASAPVYLLDWDRGCIRRRGGWEQQVLRRLRRSLEKVRRAGGEFGEREWGWLIEAYEAVLRKS
ncbi:MAG TPA: 3-deoxy-D-manno-octulosonic acid kinase [Steroidobacter sp.]|jgi:3-deoxy-D-manno-octulosonic acid kinase|nr:3-deoxy-D-manno-octulosonic acid kinase [Steroidobacteraceae bacterium]HLS81756.1 3-deoxy-D-manno-octulosonic acid kinase [Steroidobacter sp.]